MSVARALVLVLIISTTAACTVAFVSRTPAAVRSAAPGQSDPSLGAHFSDEEIARHGAYRGPLYLALALTIVTEIVALLLLARGPFESLIARAQPWPLKAILGGTVIALWLWVAAVPIQYVRGFAIQHAWGLSTQDHAGWISDQLKGIGLSIVMSAVGAVVFVAIVRAAPRTWWLIGAAAFALLNALLVFLYPVAIAPLFNKFTLVETELAAEIRSLAREAGVTVDDVVVADASRRTNQVNAYVAGIGATKQVVLDDNLVTDAERDETMFVVGHELAHAAENHIVKGVLLSTVGLVIGFLVLAGLERWPGLWSWGGAGGPREVVALPLIVLIAVVLATVSTPLQNYVSRRFEADADRIAVRLTGDPGPAIAAFRRLAFSNIADLDPPQVAVATVYSHPPIRDRITAAIAQTGNTP